jgi:hypothetical protein
MRAKTRRPSPDTDPVHQFDRRLADEKYNKRGERHAKYLEVDSGTHSPLQLDADEQCAHRQSG